jgi:hypothetical protein
MKTDCGEAARPQLSTLSLSCSPLEKGRAKGGGWIDGNGKVAKVTEVTEVTEVAEGMEAAH